MFNFLLEIKTIFLEIKWLKLKSRTKYQYKHKKIFHIATKMI